jgi:hypothetical protein
MAKPKKDKLPRPDKYAEKVAINISFDEVLSLFATKANKVVKENLELAKEDSEQLVEA